MLCNIIYTLVYNLFFPLQDLDPTRLKMAKDLGADITFEIKTKDGREVADNIVKEFGESDKTVECTGVESA